MFAVVVVTGPKANSGVTGWNPPYGFKPYATPDPYKPVCDQFVSMDPDTSAPVTEDSGGRLGLLFAGALFVSAAPGGTEDVTSLGAGTGGVHINPLFGASPGALPVKSYPHI